jgi:predicted nucleic acid-binding protein
MNPKKIIIDTGPIVAFINRADNYHHWTETKLSQLKPPFFTCESVISEACFLLRNSDKGTENVHKLLERELIQINFQLSEELKPVAGLMRKYKNIPMSLADACLVRMSEQISESAILTLDQDFKIYRKDKRKVIPVIIPMTG